MTDDVIVGIRMTTPGDINAFARAIEQKVKGYRMIKIGDRVINIDNITYIRHCKNGELTESVFGNPKLI